jgi:hypothetical protein
MEFNIEIELFEENGKKKVFLSNDGSSGCKFTYKTREELHEIISDYVDDVLDNGL